MTLFFFQLFLTVTDERRRHLRAQHHGRPTGSARHVDPLSFFGWDAAGCRQTVLFNVAYLYVALAFFIVVFVALRFVNLSRTGRAWRSLREDPLAAEMMGMPVNWLKLMAFSFGAAVAALTGTLFASLKARRLPADFQFPLLITLYSMVILGGAGSMAGVVLGAVLVNVLLEVLREPGDARSSSTSSSSLGLFAVLPALGEARRRARRHGRARFRRARIVAAIRRRGGRAARRTAAAGSPTLPRHWVVDPDDARQPWVQIVRTSRWSRSRSCSRRCTGGADRACSCRRSTSRRSSGRT